MKKLILNLAIYLFALSTFGQVGISNDNTSPDPSAMLDVKSSNRGLLPPRMNRAELSSIFSPADGLIVFCTDCSQNGMGALSIFTAGNWYIFDIGNMNLLSPLTGIHVPMVFQITWNWQSVFGVTGYKWNTSNNYATAIDLGNQTTYTETGLNCDSLHVRYVWAYNSNGHSASTALTQSTTICTSCGQDFTINHIGGPVAPVNKTVTYSMVNNIPGEPAKCWITKNLGATQQATSVYDDSEAAAGWYWQFNRKQGYKHDGSLRTPNTAWITLINESYDWQLVNDPCNLELGTTWRLPTYSEWVNVDNSCGWANWQGPYESALKLHAAGYLTDYDGSLVNRGFYAAGRYWSSTQGNENTGGHLFFYGSDQQMYYIEKANGFTIRCLRE